ncbi:hypothetical protein R2083_08880 [Nitrosomonas sp. Is35]|uniref:hypothetical protein n=1 Tax=Nitrosomonas sp. Is35 TaxID=3080534 RepID=UPI00294AD413|nr:hypothetical protein [Nitrosomonas sp. Is35]MDV6347629.1 hypothetical protein [Nitrosomonas sp. Is35]
MNDRAIHIACALAIIGGAVLWQVTATISGKNEAWDDPSYWSVTYPLSILFVGWLGYQFPEKPWRWGFSVMFGQAGMMMLSNSSFGLLPLGLILFGLLALPAAAFGQIAAKIRLHIQKI